ncbi:acetyltransferase [Streptomyces sp. NRRL B-1568]|nr:acetyltransferase [Streptomyces sp. NRRL B-1568]
MEHIIRPVRADEWQQFKALRLTALLDPAAPIAFLDTYENASAQPDSSWQERVRRSSEGKTVLAFIAECPDGEWAGTVTVLIELPGVEGSFGGPASIPQTHIVGVFVRPEHRGTGLTQALFRAALDWSWSLSDPRIERVRLYVHQDNLRAQGLYGKLGFERTGITIPMEGDPSALEYEMAINRDGTV